MTSDATSSAPSNAPAASRRWRSLWRVHFYAGIFAAPVLVMFALTGLVILYTQPVLSVSQSHLRNVTAQGAPKPYDEQLAAVQKAFPDAAVSSVVVPRNASSSTEFGLDTGRSAFVNPYTAEVLGTANPGGGIVGLSNRLHGVFNNDSVKVKLPTIAGLLGSGAVMQSFVVGDMILEVFACWAIVLVLSGLYLYWPRRSRAAGGRVAKPWVTPRLAKKGRARWRDLHAIPGMLTAVGTLFVLTTGLFWSSYWAAGYTALANKITPNNWIDAPKSSIAKIGDLDRLKNNINWNTSGQPIPNSGEPASGAADAGDQDIPRLRQVGRHLRHRQRGEIDRGLAGFLLESAADHRDEARAEALHAGVVLVAAGLVDLALAAVFGCQWRQRDTERLLATIAAAFADQRIDEQALVRIDHLAALAAAALLGRASLVVDQHADAGDLAHALLHRIELVAVDEFDAGREDLRLVPFRDVVAHHDDRLHALAAHLVRDIRHRQRAVDRLAAGHRDRIVV